MDNITIANFIKEHGGELFKKNFMGVYPIDRLTDVIKNIESVDYPFCIFNTDPEDKSGTHWCATHILNNMERTSFFIFDSFGRTGLKTFFVEDDSDILKLFITNFKDSITKMENDTESFDYFKWNVDCDKYMKLDRDNKSRLSPTCKGFMNLMMSFLKYNNRIYNEKNTSIDMYGLADQIQSINNTTCGLYALYYGYNLFNPHETFNFLEESGDLNTIKRLINNIFVDVKVDDPDKDINFTIIKQFREAFNIKSKLKDKAFLPG